MKTAISLPDDPFFKADTVAKRLGKSRSQFYADALRAYVSTHDEEAMIAEIKIEANVRAILDL